MLIVGVARAATVKAGPFKLSACFQSGTTSTCQEPGVAFAGMTKLCDPSLYVSFVMESFVLPSLFTRLMATRFPDTPSADQVTLTDW